MEASPVIDTAKRTLRLEAEALLGLVDGLDADFERLIHRLADSQGRLVVSGIGKSAIIGQKIVATLNSTGTPALFMHAADAIHGDLGMIRQDDIVMIISRSGESPEIKVLIPLIRNLGNTLVAMVGHLGSFLARQSDIILNTTVSQEACPNNLAPTSSTTAQMAMGDAIAVALMELRGFGAEDFAKFHPGGALGKKLYLHVSDLSVHNETPSVRVHSPLRDVILEMTRKRLGCTAVLDDADHLIGIITDGDLRRMMERSEALADLTAGDIMNPAPRTIPDDCLAVEALDIMRKNNITQLLVTHLDRYQGVIHLHDLVREGLI
jgi:arabinose-5-phosphate isomerase